MVASGTGEVAGVDAFIIKNAFIIIKKGKKKKERGEGGRKETDLRK